jgi:predicted nuclease of predicted toxin-antitoxin system
LVKPKNMTMFSYSPYLMVARSEINLREYTCTSELVKEIIDLRKKVLVLDSDFVESMIVHTHPLCTILLQDKNHKCSQVDELGRM